MLTTFFSAAIALAAPAIPMDVEETSGKAAPMVEKGQDAIDLEQSENVALDGKSLDGKSGPTEEELAELLATNAVKEEPKDTPRDGKTPTLIFQASLTDGQQAALDKVVEKREQEKTKPWWEKLLNVFYKPE